MKKIVDKERFTKVSRIIAGLIDTLFFVGIVIIFVLIIPKNTVEADSIIYEEYVVEKNDTLWSIATKNKSKGISVQEYIYELQELNNIDCDLQIGQVIKIIK